MIGRYNSFDGLRAIGAFGIAMMHYMANMRKADVVFLEESSILYKDVIPFFTMFVFLFFLLSAFSMCCGYYHNFASGEEGTSFDVERFFNKRYKRIFPFFALLVIIDMLMNPSMEELVQGFSDLTLAFNFLPNPNIHVIGVGWFIGVIFVFYMLFPWFVYLLKSKRRVWFAWGVALLMHLLVVKYYLTEQFVLPSEIANSRHNIVFSFPFFITGGLLYVYRKELGNKRYKFVYLTLGAICTILQIIIKPTIFGENIIFLLLTFTFWVLYAMTGGICWKNRRFLDNRIMRFFSSLSMEIYLCHMMMFRVLERLHLDKLIGDSIVLYWAYFILGITMTVLFSYVVKKVLFPFAGNRIPALAFLK